MNISHVSTPVATSEPAGTSASPATETIGAEFAALLAGALAPQLAATTPRAATPATSELDVEGGAGVEGAAVTGKDDKATDAKSSSDASLAVLGASAAGLDLTLQTKLARVITRMKNEFGLDVKLAEGIRSQQRQNQLFAQGRSTTGPIVTWTRNSLHSAGRAADLVIDGGYDDAAGFAQLRRVAEEEGLHTLGAKDPGHVELRGSMIAAMRNDGVSALAEKWDPQQLMRPTAEAQVIEAAPNVVGSIGVARVATVAAVATVARVATAARVAESGVSARLEGAPVKIAAAANTGASNHAGSNGANSGDGRDAAPRRAEAVADTRSGETVYRTFDHTPVSGGSVEAPAHDGRGDASSITAARTVRAMDAQDAPGPRTLSRLTLSLDDGQGGQDQVRIGMRGSSIGASFEMGNPMSAERVSARLGELTRALEQRGLEPQAFQVRSASTSRDADVARVATRAPDAQRSVADTSAMRHDTRSGLGGDARQQFAQHDDQRERAQRQQDEHRRRGTSFSLISEDL